MDTTALPGPAAEMNTKTAIATAMAAAENQPSRRVRRPADGYERPRLPAAGPGGRGGRPARRRGIRVSAAAVLLVYRARSGGES